MAGLQLMVLSICLVLCSLVGLSSAGCGTVVGSGGAKYDLDPLTKSTDYTGKEESTTYTYYYNFCQNIKQQTSCTNPTPAVQVSTTGTCTPIGYLPPVITETSKDNIKIVYTNNNDLCGNPKTIPRVATFLLTCSASEYNLIDEPGVCQYAFNIQTKYACSGGSPPPPPKAGGGGDKMSGGTIFLIIFFVSVAVYLLVGVVVKWRVYNASGVELVPNTELWLGLPGLIRDGFLFVKNKLTGAVGYSSL